MKKILLILTMMTSNSFAALPEPPTTATAFWSAPTTFENGEPLPAEEIAGYEFRSSCEAELIPVENSLSITFPIEVPFNCIYSVRTVLTNGVRSGFSNEIGLQIYNPSSPNLTEVGVSNI